MTGKRKYGIAISLIAVLLTALCACGAPASDGVTNVTAPATAADATAVVEAVSQSVTPMPTAAPTATPTAAPTATPGPVYVTIGAVGDIMSPENVLRGAWLDGDKEQHSFVTMFELLKPFAESVDLMCGNLETAVAGYENGKYTKSQKGVTNTFNAPDSLPVDLKACGFDVLTTGNNHCIDRHIEGLFRTATYLRELGFVQTGTYLDETDRQTPRVVEINGVRIGIVAATLSVNLHKLRLNDEQLRVNISVLMNRDWTLSDQMREDVRCVRDAGVDFVIGFMHWDAEGAGPTLPQTRDQAEELLELGVDCILASHPHRVREAEYLTVTRETGEYTGLVVYSMGNCLCSQGAEESVGLCVRLTLEKGTDGTVTLHKAEYMPTICYLERDGYDRRYQIVPALLDQTRLKTRYDAISNTLAYGMNYARELCDKKYKLNTVMEPMDESCWIN